MNSVNRLRFWRCWGHVPVCLRILVILLLAFISQYGYRGMYEKLGYLKSISYHVQPGDTLSLRFPSKPIYADSHDLCFQFQDGPFQQGTERQIRELVSSVRVGAEPKTVRYTPMFENNRNRDDRLVVGYISVPSGSREVFLSIQLDDNYDWPDIITVSVSYSYMYEKDWHISHGIAMDLAPLWYACAFIFCITVLLEICHQVAKRRKSDP